MRQALVPCFCFLSIVGLGYVSFGALCFAVSLAGVFDLAGGLFFSLLPIYTAFAYLLFLCCFSPSAFSLRF